MKLEEFVRRSGARPAFLHLAAMDDMEMESARPGYAVVAGIAIISVCGLLGEEDYCDTHYSDITAELAQAEADPDVTCSVLLAASPGGFTDGAFECAASIAAAKKPVFGVASPYAYSGAYLLLSQASKIYVPPVSGGVGSVGVYCSHVDISSALDKAGIKVTLFSAGEGKTAGNSYEPLSPDAAKSMQAEVDRLYTEFVAAVSRGRKMSPDQVVKLGAKLYEGSAAALGAGLADETGDLGTTILALSQGAGRFSARAGEKGSEQMDAAAIQTAVNEARAAGFADAQEISELCFMTGKPERVTEFLRDKKTAAQVRTALMAERAAAAGDELNRGITPGGDTTGNGTASAAAYGKAEDWGTVLEKQGLKKKA